MTKFECTKNCSLLAVGVLLLSACSAEVGLAEDVMVATQALEACTANTGKWQHLANLSVATAHEMGELNSSRQFAVVTSGGKEKVVLSSYGAAVCAARGGCPMVQGYLDLQDLTNDEDLPEELFNTSDYRSTMVGGYKRQVIQLDQLLANARWGDMPEDHSVSLIGRDGTSACGTPTFAFFARRDLHLQFSATGPISGLNCTQITEPYDPHGWNNSYLCSERPLGLKWSSSGVIEGMTCVNVAEPTENVWSDNYLCTPEDWGLTFSNDGIPADKDCVALAQPSEPNGWQDNHLCWDPSAKLNHASSLCQEFFLFGGTAACDGDNPYTDFSASDLDSSFKIDPTDYTPGSPPPTNPGACVVSLPLVSTDPDVEGDCCYQGGRYGYLVMYTTIANTYYCRTG